MKPNLRVFFFVDNIRRIHLLSCKFAAFAWRHIWHIIKVNLYLMEYIAQHSAMVFFVLFLKTNPN